MITVKKDDAKDQKRDLPPVEQNPAHIKSDRQRHQAGAEGYEEGYGFATSHWHGLIVRLVSKEQEVGGRRQGSRQTTDAGGRRQMQEQTAGAAGRKKKRQ